MFAFVLLVVVTMEEFRNIGAAVDDFDLTPRAPVRPMGGDDMFSTSSSAPLSTSEGFGGGVSAWMQQGLVSPHRVFRK